MAVAFVLDRHAMASLANSRSSLRFSLELAALESGMQPPARGDEGPLRILPEKPAVAPRLLASVSMDFYDQRDREFWPFVRQAVLWLGPGDVDDVVRGLEGVLRDEVAGFAFRSGGGELGIQVGRAAPQPQPSSSPGGGDPASPHQKDAFAVEVGLDLATVLDEAAGAGHGAGEQLSLFRFVTGRAQLVSFGQALRDELFALRGERRPPSP